MGVYMKKNKWKNYFKIGIEKAIPFLINIIFVMGFGFFFGNENILLSVSIGVGLTMFPLCPLQWKPSTLFLIVLFLYGVGALMGETYLLSPFLAFLLNFIFVILIVLLSSEPSSMKPSISFLLCFVFAESTSVPIEMLPKRLLCAITGSIIVTIVTLLFWKKKGYNRNGRTLIEQIELGNKNHHYMFRMAFGIALAIFIGMVFHLKKPLWISIVVMSLTQLDFEETIDRIKNRFIGNLLGMLLFFIFFQFIIPKEYALYVILLLGYMGSFFSEYKYKQTINAISALNASLVLLDTSEALLDRLLFLGIGICIVLSIYYLATFLKKMYYTYLYDKIASHFPFHQRKEIEL